MAGYTNPGVLCSVQTPGVCSIDTGTLMRQRSTHPCTLGASTLFPAVSAGISVTHSQESTPREVIAMHLSEYRRFAQQAALTYPDTFHWVTDGVLDGKEILKFVTKTFPAVKFGRIIIRTYEGEKYIIFKGYAGLRTIFTGTRYRADNVKIVDLMVGEAGIVKSAVEGTALSVVVVSVIDVLQAYLSDDEMLKEDLPFTLAIDALKTLAATVVGLAAGLALVGTGIACAPVAGVIVVGICVAWTLNHFFPTEQIADEMRRWFDRQLQKEQTFLAHAGHLITEADHLWREIGKAATTLDHVYTRAEQEILNLVNPLRGF